VRQIVLLKPGIFKDRSAAHPVVGPNEALVRMHRIGVCGSDLNAFKGEHPAYSFPRVLGHELGVEVVEARENNFGIKAGDRCAVESFYSCGGCQACWTGRTNCCETLKYLGIHIDGGMQALLNVPVSKLHKSSQLSFDQLALIEPLAVGAHAVVRSGLQPGEDVLVIGSGVIGMAVAQFAKAAGAGGRVRVVEKIPQRRHLAKKIGVDVLPATDDNLYSVVFDATGSTASMEASFESVSPGGRLVFVGLVSGRISFADWLFHRREMTVLATRGSLNQFPKVIRMVEDGEIDTSLWITHRLELREVPSQFARLRSCSDLMKAMIHVDGSDL
jgi:2-desacetyl-2-hydroxyethyl bacteriochlorophyllide A dehydrogenase